MYILQLLYAALLVILIKNILSIGFVVNAEVDDNTFRIIINIQQKITFFVEPYNLRL